MVALVLFISRASSFAITYQVVMGMVTSLEASIVSVERCKAFEEIDSEPGYFCIGEDEKTFMSPHKNL